MKFNHNFKSPNYSQRQLPIKYIIMHYTEMLFEDAIHRLLDPKTQVSAHYLIRNDGEIFNLVDDNKIAWHAGESYWYGQEKLNQNSIGIELDNLGKEAFSKEQIESCLNLCLYLKGEYKLPSQNFIGHSDVAPARKIDPGLYFNWQYFAKNDLGIWHNLECPERDKVKFFYGDNGEEVLLLQKGLQNLGYNITLTGEFDEGTNYVVRSFQAKYVPKIIIDKGVGLYFEKSSKYDWTEFSHAILQELLSIP